MKIDIERLKGILTTEEIKELDSTDVVLISNKEYDRLSKRSCFLYCLETAGVDNWEGYGIAQDDFNED